MLRSLAIALAALSATPAFAQSAPTCNDPDVRSIERPYLSSEPQGRKFTFKYRHRLAKPGQPTLVYIPGGPGGDSINQRGNQMTTPEGWGLIQTDPRGIGCNELTGQVPDAFYTSEHLADDIVAMLKHAKLERYILHGISYGTVVGTIAAVKAEKAGVKPEAVILEGILGRVFAPGEVSQTFIDEWQITMDQRLAPQVAEIFKLGEPLGFTSEEWGRFLSTYLTIGILPKPKYDFLPAYLMGVVPEAPVELKDALKSMVKSAATPEAKPAAEHMFKIIACHEIAGEVTSFHFNADFTLKNGKLSAVPGHLCDGIALDRPFDAADWQTTAPLYYFEGDRDPSTPQAQALYNYDSQKLAKKKFVSVEGGSHVAMTMNLADCRPAILSEIADGGDKLEDALKTCVLGTKIR